jgi:hypothetical protein
MSREPTLGRGAHEQAWRRTDGLNEPPAEREKQQPDSERSDQESSFHTRQTPEQPEIFPATRDVQL